MNIGKAIKHARTKREMTLKELASKANLTLSYLSLLERNKRNPNMSTVLRISEALRMPAFLLIADAEIIDSDNLEGLIGLEVVEKLSKEILEVLK